MAGSNGIHPGTVHTDPTGVFGRIGLTLPLGARQVSIRILTNREVKAQMPLLDALTYVFAAGPDVGRQVYESTMLDERRGEPAWEKLAAWLTAWLTEPVTPDDFEDATPDELIALIDAIFEQSGLQWLRRQLGNAGLAAQVRAAQLASQPPESPPGGPESDSTTSTTSSSASPDHPPTPAPTSPSTD